MKSLNGLLIAFLLLCFLIFGITFLYSSAKENTLKNDSSILLNTILKQIKQDNYLDKDFLYNNSCFHIAKALINKENPCYANKLYLAKLACGTGWFDEGYNFSHEALNLASTNKEKVAAYFIQWQCDLNAMDTLKARETLQKINVFTNELKDYDLQLQYNIYSAYHYHNLERYSQALQLLHTAELLNKKVNREDSIWLGNTYQKMGNSFTDICCNHWNNIYNARVAYDSAKIYYYKALKINVKLFPKIHPRVGLTYFTLGMLEKATDHLELAEQDYLESFTHLTLNGFNVHPIYTSIALTQLSETYFLKYNKSHSKNNLNKALQYAKLNNEYLKDELLNYSTNAGRDELVKYFKQLSFDNMANMEGSIYTKGIYPIDTILFQVSTQSKNGSTIKLYLQNTESKVFDGLQDETKRVLKETNFISTILNNTYLKDSVENWSKKNDKNITGLSTLYNDAIDTIKIKKYCNDNNTIILDYYVTDNKLFINKFTGNASSLIVKEMDPQVNSQLSAKLYNFMVNNQTDSFQTYAYRCYQLLLKDVLPDNTVKVIIVPDRFLSQLPWDAFVTKINMPSSWANLNYLNKKLLLHQAISFNQLMYIDKKNGVKNFACFLPVFINDKKLTETEKLLNQLHKDYSAAIYYGKDVDAKIINNTQAAIVHFATHTIGKDNDKSLELNDGAFINALNGNIGKFKADLVVLNACGTQHGKYFYAEGYYNLPKLFMSNGCSSVISSLWNVDEAASADFFSKFYYHLKCGNDKDVALNKAQNSFINDPKYPDWANPYYWSAYLLTGNAKPIAF